MLIPKLEVSIKKQERGEIFTVTMGLVVKRLANLEDTILVEVKEFPAQITSNQDHNNVPKRRMRLLEEEGCLNSARKELAQVRYSSNCVRVHSFMVHYCEGNGQVSMQLAIQDVQWI